MVGLTPYEIQLPEYEHDETRVMVRETLCKIYQHFSAHENILVSVSGGSDSDCIVHLICKYYPEFLPKVHFVFVNTGLEYDATKRHLHELENKYGIEIKQIRGKSVVWACKQYGFPILSKLKSHLLNHYLRGNPCGEKFVFSAPGKWHGLNFTENQKRLAKYLKDNGIMVSAKCCKYSKKEPLDKFAKENNVDLQCTGERRAEDGQRALKHRTCFEVQKSGKKKYMPLFWWSDSAKKDFKDAEKIRFSDCYEIWGLKRTGCVGCPFNQNIANDLEKMREFEPKLFAACMRVFGQSYALMDKFGARRKKCLPPIDK